MVSFAQAKKQHGKSGAPTTINFSDTAIKDYLPNLLHLDQHPVPTAEYGNKKIQLDKMLHKKTEVAMVNFYLAQKPWNDIANQLFRIW